jgi:hypothetical protein
MLNYLNFVNVYSSTRGTFGGGSYAENKPCTGTSKNYQPVGEIGKTLRISDPDNSYTSSLIRNDRVLPYGYTYTVIPTKSVNQCAANEADISGGELNVNYAATGLDGATGLGSDGVPVG